MIRRGSLLAFATSALLLISSAATPTYAVDALRIGLSLSLTGSTAPAGKQVLAGLEIWQTTFDKVIGPIAFGQDGEWTTPRIICIQFQGISGNGLDQFKDWARQVVVYPHEYKAGNLIYPFEKAAQ